MIILIYILQQKLHTDLFKTTMMKRSHFQVMILFESTNYIMEINPSNTFCVDCKPVRMWSIIRHGARNPNRKTIALMRNHLTHIRDDILEHQFDGKLCSSDIELFRRWEPNLSENESKHLVFEGTDELIGLAERMQSRFPNILSDIYINNTFKV